MMFYCDSVFVTGSHCTLEWCCVTFHLKPWYGITAPVTDELLLKWGWLAAMGHEDTYAPYMHCLVCFILWIWLSLASCASYC